MGNIGRQQPRERRRGFCRSGARANSRYRPAKAEPDPAKQEDSKPQPELASSSMLRSRMLHPLVLLPRQQLWRALQKALRLASSMARASVVSGATLRHRVLPQDFLIITVSKGTGARVVACLPRCHARGAPRGQYRLQIPPIERVAAVAGSEGSTFGALSAGP
jgi:hypothetical protein